MKDYLWTSTKNEDLFASDGYIHAAPDFGEPAEKEKRRHCVKKRTKAAESERQTCLRCTKEHCNGSYYCMNKRRKKERERKNEH